MLIRLKIACFQRQIFGKHGLHLPPVEWIHSIDRHLDEHGGASSLFDSKARTDPTELLELGVTWLSVDGRTIISCGFIEAPVRENEPSV